jgi:type II secretory pathway pseudopilin PulG
MAQHSTASHERLDSESGFSLAELLVATLLLLIVSSIVTNALLQMSKHQQTIWNRTEMHSGVRGATELLQQEVGQAGRITLPGTVTLVNAVTGSYPCTTSTVTVASTAGAKATAGMFVTEALTTLDGDNEESVSITAIPSTTTFTACFTASHAAGTVFIPMGGFATGIVPPTGVTSGSTANVLKLYGDINGDGNMVYIEYYCDNGDPGTLGTFNLYRNIMAFDAAPPKPSVTNSMILLNNVHPNPADQSGSARPCFQYQTVTVRVNGTPFTFVLDVAVTLTVQTQQIDPITRQYQTETKALLNVSPRNVFGAWELAAMGYTNRIQSTPATVTALLP